MSTEIKTVKTAGFEMKYFCFGTGRKTMVIIPGLSLISVMTSAPAIEAAYAVFGEEYTVCVFDRRSDLPGTYTVADMAEDTAAAMKALGISGAFLFGTSQGGMIAQIIAAEHPELVKKMVLGSTAARMDDAAGRGLEKWRSLAESGKTEELVMMFAQDVYSEDYMNRYKDAFKGLAGMVTEEDLRRFSILVAGTEGLNVYDSLDRIKCPVLAVGDRDDRIFGAKGTVDIAEKLGCEMYLYEGYGHAVYDEAPDYRSRIFEFFEK